MRGGGYVLVVRWFLVRYNGKTYCGDDGVVVLMVVSNNHCLRCCGPVSRESGTC